MNYTVRFAPEAVEQLAELYRYIAAAGSPETDAGYVDAVVSHCEGLAVFPHRGAMRDDIRPGLRTMNFRKRVVIALAVDDDPREVTILGVFYGGQDYQSMLSGVGDGD